MEIFLLFDWIGSKGLKCQKGDGKECTWAAAAVGSRVTGLQVGVLGTPKSPLCLFSFLRKLFKKRVRIIACAAQGDFNSIVKKIQCSS